MEKSILHLSVKLEQELAAKFCWLVKYHGRSRNGELAHIIKRHVQQFEEQCYPIDPEAPLCG